MKTQTRLIFCAATCALALLALASVPPGTQGRSTQFLRAGAGNTNEGRSHPFVSCSILAEDPDNPIDMNGITTGPRAAPTPPADPDKPIPMDDITTAKQLEKYCRNNKRRLYDTLRELRERKKYDASSKGTCIYQKYLKEKIRIVIEALITCEGYYFTLEEEKRRRSEAIDNSEDCPPPGVKKAEVKSGQGLLTATFDTAQGKLNVYLPDDMAA